MRRSACSTGSTPQLFRAVNHNPIQFLISLPKERIRQLAQDRGFLFELDEVWQQFQQYMQYNERFKTTYDGGPRGEGHRGLLRHGVRAPRVHPDLRRRPGRAVGRLPQGRLGREPALVGVGLVYKYGYFTQRITASGEQEEQSAEFDNHLIPMHELRGPEGDKAYIEMQMLDQTVKIKLWQIDVGKTRLILLDTDLEENPPHLRDITQELYVADRTKRLQQELVLGIGGVRALERLGIEPQDLPHQRRPLGLPDPGAAPAADAAGEARLHGGQGHDPRLHRVHHAHAGHRRQRELRYGDREGVHRARGAVDWACLRGLGVGTTPSSTTTARRSGCRPLAMRFIPGTSTRSRRRTGTSPGGCGRACSRTRRRSNYPSITS